MIASWRKQADLRREYTLGRLRLVTSFVLAMVVSGPLKLLMFEKEINVEMAQRRAQNYQSQKRAALEAPGDALERQRLQNENMQFAGALRTAEGSLEERYKAFMAGAPQTENVTFYRNRQIYQAGKQRYQQAEGEVAALRETTQRRIAQNRAHLDELAGEQRKRLAAIEAAQSQADTPLARAEALHALTSRSLTAAEQAWGLTAVLFLLETCPVLIKLLSAGNRVRSYEENVEAFAEAETETANALRRRVNARAQLDKKEAEEEERLLMLYEQQGRDALLRLIAEKQQTLAEEAIDDWFTQAQRQIHSPQGNNPTQGTP